MGFTANLISKSNQRTYGKKVALDFPATVYVKYVAAFCRNDGKRDPDF